MGKPRMIGAFKPYTHNSKMDMRYRSKQFQRQKEIADNATPKEDRKVWKTKNG